MGKLVLYIAVSKDGYIARSNGSVDFLTNYDPDDCGYSEFYNSVSSLIIGGKTFRFIQEISDIWPYDKPSFVVTRFEIENINSESKINQIPFIKIKSVIQELKTRNGDIWLVGGAELFQSLLKFKLIDEVCLTIIPIELGSGISLFGDSQDKINSQLIKIKHFKNGVEENRYKLVYL